MDSDTGKRLALFGGLFVLALLINGYFFSRATDKKEAAAKLEADKKEAVRIEQDRESQAKDEAEKFRKKEAARQEAAEAAAAAHQSYLSRYINSGFSRTPGVPAVAVAVAAEDGRANPAIAQALSRRFQTNELQVMSAFFKPAFVADGMVAGVFEGRTDFIERMELTNSLDAILVGKQQAEYSTNTTLENTITANLQLDLMAVAVARGLSANSWKFVGRGVGFTRHEARQLAQERIVNQINGDTNFTLEPVIQATR